MISTRKIQKFFKKVRRAGVNTALAIRQVVIDPEDVVSDLRRSFRRTRAHKILMNIKEMIPSRTVVIPPVEIGPDGKIFFSLDQLSLLASAYLRQEGFDCLPRWKSGWTIVPAIKKTSPDGAEAVIASTQIPDDLWFAGLEFEANDKFSWDDFAAPPDLPE